MGIVSQNDKIKSCNVMIYFFIICFLVTMGFMVFVRGNFWSMLFYGDSLDTGMDFFHSIEYTVGRSPYELYNTLYPPLANLFFYILLQMIPEWEVEKWAGSYAGGIQARGTSADLRVWQPTLLIFMIFIMVMAVLLVFLSMKLVGMNSRGFLAGVCVLLSYGVLYSFERGNIIVISAIGILFFVLYKDSSNRNAGELALIALAVAAGLKVYPAVFGILLLADKQYKKAVRALIYGILAFFLPFLAFEEGFGAIGQFFSHAASFASESGFSCMGTSFAAIAGTVVMTAARIFGANVNEEMLGAVLSIFNIPALVILLLMVFVLQKNWQKLLAVTLGIMLYASQGQYILIFMVIPLLFFLREETELSKSNILPFAGMIGMIVLLPLSNALIGGYTTAQYVRVDFCIVLLLVSLVINVIQAVKAGWRPAMKRKVFQ